MKLIEHWLDNSLSSVETLHPIRVIATTEPKCNLACEHCYWPHDLVRAELCDWQDAITYLKPLHIPLFFAGRILNEKGARFLRPLIEQQACSELGIVDNGTTIMDYPEFFPYYRTVNISIDGWRDEHDRQRRKKGSFDTAWNTVLKLKDLGLNPIIASAISPLTINKWPLFEELLMEHNVSMSSTPVMPFPETERRKVSMFDSKSELRRAFEILLDGMPKLVNLYDISYVDLIKDILKSSEWSVDRESGDCIKAVLPTRTIIVYRPVSLLSIAELSLQWDGKFYTSSTYGFHTDIGEINRAHFDRVAQMNKKELEVWSQITPLVERG